MSSGSDHAVFVRARPNGMPDSAFVPAGMVIMG